MPEIEANGLTVHYAVEGEGPPMLLLHGATSDGTNDWGAQRPLLRRERTLYMPDARSHARTRWDPRAGWNGSMLVDDALAFADALGLDSVHLMGLSMGARTALALAIRAPGRVRSLIAIGAASQHEPAASVARRRLDPDWALQHEPAWVEQMVGRHDRFQGEGHWRQLAVALRADLQQIEPFATEDTRGLRMPVLLAYGDRDPWSPMEHAVRLRRQLPNASLLLVPDCGHVVEAERPSVFNPAMSQFVRRTQGLG